MDDSLRPHRSWSAWRPKLRNPKAASADCRTSVVVAREPADLSRLIPAWDELAAAALEPNVFYEHWMLIPALEGLRLGEDVSIVLVLIRDSHNPKGLPKLGALFPLQRMRQYKLIPAAAYRMWRHQHCYLATPLVRADAARECLTEFFWWLLSNGEDTAGLLELWGVRGDGPFHRALVDVSNELGLMNWVSESHTRGLLRRKLGANEPDALEVPGGLRRLLRRKERRLNERGTLEHVALGPDGDVSRWIEEFVSVEARGWKGKDGSALACSEADRRYFASVVDSAFRRGRLLMIGIDFDGRPIARRCGFTAGEGSFAFKTAYDEEFARFSPGVMLEIDNLKQFYALPELRWMDSCTASDNFTINRLWNDRITIQSLAIGSGSWSELVISTVPMLRWLRRRLPGGHWDRD